MLKSVKFVTKGLKINMQKIKYIVELEFAAIIKVNIEVLHIEYVI